MQGTREDNDRDHLGDHKNDVKDLQALYTRRHLSSDVAGSSHESNKSRKVGSMKCVTTRIVRKTTTMTRGEEKSVSESMMRAGEVQMLQMPGESTSETHSHHEIQAKRAKVKENVPSLQLSFQSYCYFVTYCIQYVPVRGRLV